MPRYALISFFFQIFGKSPPISKAAHLPLSNTVFCRAMGSLSSTSCFWLSLGPVRRVKWTPASPNGSERVIFYWLAECGQPTKRTTGDSVPQGSLQDGSPGDTVSSSQITLPGPPTPLALPLPGPPTPLLPGPLPYFPIGIPSPPRCMAGAWSLMLSVMKTVGLQNRSPRPMSHAAMV